MNGTRVAISPDGRTIVYVGSGEGGGPNRLWVRSLDQLRATPLPGTERAANPSFSPDGKRIAFVTTGQPRAIKVVPLAGGPALTLTDSLVDLGGLSWASDGYIYYDGHLEGDGLGLAEVVLLPRSPFLGRTPKNLRMRERYHIQVLAINRRTGFIRSKIADTRMQLGDVLLVQGTPEQIAALQNENAFDVLGVMDAQRFNRQRALTVMAIFAAALLLGTFQIVPLPAAMLLGAFLVFVTRTISP